MKILHLSLQAPYNEGWGYQENLITKYQVKLGHDVTLVTTCRVNSTNSKIDISEPQDYMSPDGFRVIRLMEKEGVLKKIHKMLCVFDIYSLLKEIAPDFIMIHGLGSYSALQVKKYVKRINPKCIVVADNHVDENNTSVIPCVSFKKRVFVFLWQYLNYKMRHCYKRVYGVSPRRTEIANTVFKIPSNLLDTLPAGADDEQIKFSDRELIKNNIRSSLDISNDDFLIVTGGKIDETKNIDALMEAVSSIDQDNVKLIVFGNCSDSIREKIVSISNHKSIRYIGWISSDRVYDYFLASDLVVFPGLHSVMWEQACATKIPCVFHRLDGFDHFDIGGNCVFIDDVSAQGLEITLKQLLFTDKYYEMKKVAESEKTDVFLYSNIAKKALEVKN